MADIRALSIRQPWANLVMSGTKTVENRSWTRARRGLLVIHAGQIWVPAGQEFAAEQGVWVERTSCGTGYLGTVDLIDIHEDTGCCRPWGFPGGYHWVVENPRRFETPVPGHGRLGLYVPPAEVLEMVRAEVSRG